MVYCWLYSALRDSGAKLAPRKNSLTSMERHWPCHVSFPSTWMRRTSLRGKSVATPRRRWRAVPSTSIHQQTGSLAALPKNPLSVTPSTVRSSYSGVVELTTQQRAHAGDPAQLHVVPQPADDLGPDDGHTEATPTRAVGDLGVGDLVRSPLARRGHGRAPEERRDWQGQTRLDLSGRDIKTTLLLAVAVTSPHLRKMLSGSWDTGDVTDPLTRWRSYGRVRSDRLSHREPRDHRPAGGGLTRLHHSPEHTPPKLVGSFAGGRPLLS
jgi:hypothetical protein